MEKKNASVWLDGKRVRQYRQGRFWSQNELAKQAKLSKRTIEKIESVSGRVMRHTLRVLADALEVSPQNLLDLERSSTITNDKSASGLNLSGSVIEIQCSQCQTVNGATKQFCTTCGYELKTKVTTLIGGNLSPIVEKKAWGCETIIGVTDRVALKKLVLMPNTLLSRQVHSFKAVLHYVISGKGRLELGTHGEIVHMLSEGDAIHLPPGVIYRFLSEEEGIEVIEVSTPEISDVIRIEDNYSRQVNSDFDPDHYRQILKQKTF